MGALVEAPSRGRDRWLGWASTLAAVVPIVVAGARALRDPWVAIGDNAVLLVRSRDVLTADHPWLGSWTSVSGSSGRDLNNPGPLYWDLLALPAKLLGDAGMVVGVVTLNVAAVLGVAWVANRLAGPTGLAVAMAMAAAIGWTMGSELLFDPWQPDALVYPFLLLLALTWGLLAGQWDLLPWMVGVGSLLVQTHLSYVYLVPSLVAFGVGAAAFGLWRDRSVDGWPLRRRQARRAAAWSAVVGAVLWAQPLYEQLFGPDEGNLRRLLASGDAGAPRIGSDLAVRFVAAVVSLPPWWARPSWVQAIRPDPADLGWAAASLALVLGAVGLVGLQAWRRRDRVAVAVAVLALAAIAGSVATVALTPVSGFGYNPHAMRWLWCVSVLWMGAVALGVARCVLGPPGRRALRLGAVVVAVVLGAATLPRHAQDTGPTADRDAAPFVRRLLPQLDELRGRDLTVEVELSELDFGDVYLPAVLARLQELGVDFEVRSEQWVRQLGEGRRAEGGADRRLYLRKSAGALDVPTGAERVALVVGLADGDRAEMVRRQREAVALVRSGGVTLTASGRDAYRRGLITLPDGTLEDPAVAARLVRDGILAPLLRRAQLAVAGLPMADSTRLGALQHSWHRNTVGVYLGPLDPP